MYSGSSVVPAERLLDLRRQKRAEPVRLGDEVGERGGRVGEHERAQARRLCQRVLLAEKAAPGLAEDVVAAGDPECVDEVVQLADEEVDGPEVGAAVGVMRAPAVPDLVVVDDGAAVGQVGEREEIVVRRARTAVKDDERCGSRGVAGAQIPGHAVPRLRFAERDGAFVHVHARDSTPLSTFPRIPHPLASAGRAEESGATLVSATPTRRRERALSEAEAYARCHGHRALCRVRISVAPDRDERLRTALTRALEGLCP